MKLLRPGIVILALMTFATGMVYPLAMTLAAQLLMPGKANGSLVSRDGRAVGSLLLGQEFTSPGYFWGRPSATSPSPYTAAASSGSNLGPRSEVLQTMMNERIDDLRQADPEASGPVPVDLVTASASGLDPHISPAGAYYQAARVARSRGLSAERIEPLIEAHTEARWLGLFGEPRVNVLELNLALDTEAVDTQ